MARIWVESVERSTAKTGNDFLKVQALGEDKVSRLLYLWDDVDDFQTSFLTGNHCFECTFGGDANFPKIATFEMCPGDATEFMNFVYSSDVQATQIVNSLIAQISDPFYSALIQVVLSLDGPDEFSTVKDAFCVIPAAKAYHHDFRYGLVKHTHEVMSFVARVCSSDLYKDTVDAQTALTGAFLHDVGKCFEYSFDGVNHADYGDTLSTNQIFLASHLYKGAELIEVAFRQLIINGSQQGVNYDTTENKLKVEHLKHIVLSHHLQREWAAVSKAPQTLEAYLVFLADYFSAAFGKFQAIDWSQVSPTHLIGSTSKFDTFFGFTPCLKNLADGVTE